MPNDLFLDGELWYNAPPPSPYCNKKGTHLLLVNRFGHDNFQEALKISNRVDPDLIDWKKFKFMVFDIPTHKGTYQERYEALGVYTCLHAFELFCDTVMLFF